MNTMIKHVTTINQAFRILDITEPITRRGEILEAFQRVVKAASDGRGGYVGDVNDLRFQSGGL